MGGTIIGLSGVSLNYLIHHGDHHDSNGNNNGNNGPEASKLRQRLQQV